MPEEEERDVKRSLPVFLLENSITSKDFYRILKTSKSLVAGDLLFRYLKHPKPLLGMIVSRSYGKSHERNLFKRRCRSIFTDLIKIQSDFSVIVKPLHKKISNKQIQTSFDLFQKRIHV